MTNDTLALTPKEIVTELDKYIIGQNQAKRSVAVALRNRWRRQHVSEDIKNEIVPKNILMVGPTGVGKTEISRRLARLSNSPFIKVEATKYTEIGYVGREVDSIIRDLADISVRLVYQEELKRVKEIAEKLAVELIRNQLDPNGSKEEFYENIKCKKYDDKHVNVELQKPPMQASPMQVFSSGGMQEMNMDFQGVLGDMMPKQTVKKRVLVPDAMKILIDEESKKLIDMDDVISKAMNRAEQNGIVFIDEIDKIAGGENGAGPNVSRGGVQRDLLSIVEGCVVPTKYGVIDTQHILFIASGAFSMSKPSDLIPELQGRFPVRARLNSLTREDLIRILTEPENALTKQYIALMQVEDIQLKFSKSVIESIADVAVEMNAQIRDTGARRLHTIMEKMLEDVFFNDPEKNGETIKFDPKYVKSLVPVLVENEDTDKTASIGFALESN